MDDRRLSEFLAEAEELVEELYADVAALRARRGEGRARRELVGRLFRHVHTFKGTAAAAGLEAAGALAHEFETLLDAVRLGRASADESVLDAFDDAAAALGSEIDAASRGEGARETGVLVARLRTLAREGAAASADEEDVAGLLPSDVAWELTAYERRRLYEAVREGARAYVVRADFDLTDFDEQFRRMCEALDTEGETIATQPGVEPSAPERVTFRVVCASDAGRERLSEILTPFGARLSEGALAANVEQSNGEDTPPRRVEGEDATGARGHAVAPAAYVRASLEELDEIVAAAHDLFAETLAALEESRAGTGARDSSSVSVERVRRDFLALEERIIALRMAQVGPTLERAARAGRAAARASGKSVEFEVVGGGVRLDRTLAERLADPLLHLVRNAVDHGVEHEAERLSAGKPARGRVRVEASTDGSRVALRVTDDGRGVDPERVAREASERGLVPSGAAVSERQALRLIFRPGFSTAADVSLVSGRGVGLEIVEREVEEAGGEVRVSTERGRGTSFEMRVPTPLALLPALLVRSCGRVYCVAAAHLVESGRASREDLNDDGSRLRLDGRELSVVNARALLGQPPPDGSGDLDSGVEFVVVRTRDARGEGDEDGHGRTAVVVDALEGRAEVLVRGLGRHATRWRGVSGATELRDGTVALVLDLPRLVEAHAG
ncbi:MAG TPA: ATP-binding protein [Pyrinomonadaceae bacterium]|nr:ATP-binding protein [Pyrinomonadaceae bacterium]